MPLCQAFVFQTVEISFRAGVTDEITALQLAVFFVTAPVAGCVLVEFRVILHISSVNYPRPKWRELATAYLSI